MNSDGLMPRMAACCSTSAFSAVVMRGFGPFTRRSSGAFVGRAMHRSAASFLRSKNTSGYPDQDTAGLVKASIKCRGIVLPDGRTAPARLGECISAHSVISTGPLSENPTLRRTANRVCISAPFGNRYGSRSAGQSMQETPETLRLRLLWLWRRGQLAHTAHLLLDDLQKP